MIDDPEEEAWRELEQKLNKSKNQVIAIKPWIGLTDQEIAYAAHIASKPPVAILETSKGLCVKFSKWIEWYCSDNHGDYMVVNDFLIAFAQAIEAELKIKNT